MDTSRTYSAFGSAGSEQQDARVISWFFEILRKHDVEPIFATNLPEPRPPLEKIKDLIQKSGLFIAVLTKRDKIEGKNLWKGPDWVQNEIGFAIGKKEALLSFCRRGN